MGKPVNTLFIFLSGAAMFGAWTAGVFFLRFWKKTKDRLFLVFGLAFWILALERVVLLMIGDPSGESDTLIYVMRLFAFSLILWAIIDKNRKSSAL